MSDSNLTVHQSCVQGHCWLSAKQMRILPLRLPRPNLVGLVRRESPLVHSFSGRRQRFDLVGLTDSARVALPPGRKHKRVAVGTPTVPRPVTGGNIHQELDSSSDCFLWNASAMSCC